jgi:hypothetical protein
MAAQLGEARPINAAGAHFQSARSMPSCPTKAEFHGSRGDQQ